MRVFKVANAYLSNTIVSNYNLLEQQSQGQAPLVLLGDRNTLLVTAIDYSFRKNFDGEVIIDNLTISNITYYSDLLNQSFSLRFINSSIIDDFTTRQVALFYVLEPDSSYTLLRLRINAIEENVLHVTCIDVEEQIQISYSNTVKRSLLLQIHNDEVIATFTSRNQKMTFGSSIFDDDITECNALRSKKISASTSSIVEYINLTDTVRLPVGEYLTHELIVDNLMFLTPGYDVNSVTPQPHLLDTRLALIVGTSQNSFAAFDVVSQHANCYSDYTPASEVVMSIIEQSEFVVARSINYPADINLLATYWLYYSKDRQSYYARCNSVDFTQRRGTSTVVLLTIDRHSKTDNRLALVAIIYNTTIQQYAVVMRDIEITNYADNFINKHRIRAEFFEVWQNQRWSRTAARLALSHRITIREHLGNIRSFAWALELFDVERGVYVIDDSYEVMVTRSMVIAPKPYYITKPSNHIAFFCDSQGEPAAPGDVIAVIQTTLVDTTTLIIRNIPSFPTNRYRLTITYTDVSNTTYTRVYEYTPTITNVSQPITIDEEGDWYFTYVNMQLNEPFALTIYADEVGNYCVYETTQYNNDVYYDSAAQRIYIRKSLIDNLQLNTFRVMLRGGFATPIVAISNKQPHIKLDNIYYLRALACECPAYMPMTANEVHYYIAPVRLYSRGVMLPNTPAGQWFLHNITPNTCVDSIYESTMLVAYIPSDYIDITLHFSNRVDGAYVQGVHSFRVRGVLRRQDDETVEERYVTQQRNELSLFRGYRKQYELELYLNNALQLNSVELMKYARSVSIRTRRGLIRDYKQLIVQDYKVIDNIERITVIVSLREELLRVDYRYKL